MADVYGRLTGRAAVAMATLGTGCDEPRDRRRRCVPGPGADGRHHRPGVELDKLHKEAHQVVDIVRMMEPVTKWNTRVERVEAIPEIVRKAFRVATLEKPGPTHIELPENLAAMDVPPADDGGPSPLVAGSDLLPRADRRRDRPRCGPAGRRSERPIVLAGNGVLRRGARRGPPRLRPRAPRPGRGDVHGQGRHRRPVASLAHGGRPPGPRSRPDRVRPGGPRHLRRL